MSQDEDSKDLDSSCRVIADELSDLIETIESEPASNILEIDSLKESAQSRDLAHAL